MERPLLLGYQVSRVPLLGVKVCVLLAISSAPAKELQRYRLAKLTIRSGSLTLYASISTKGLKKGVVRSLCTSLFICSPDFWESLLEWGKIAQISFTIFSLVYVRRIRGKYNSMGIFRENSFIILPLLNVHALSVEHIRCTFYPYSVTWCASHSQYLLNDEASDNDDQRFYLLRILLFSSLDFLLSATFQPKLLSLLQIYLGFFCCCFFFYFKLSSFQAL